MISKENIINQVIDFIPANLFESEAKTQTLEFLSRNLDYLKINNPGGHITVSAVVFSLDYNSILLVKHRKLKKWLQLGGHLEDTDESLIAGVRREVFEESGLPTLIPLKNEIFSIDVHFIENLENSEKHTHYDIRYLFVCDKKYSLSISNESVDLKWISVQELNEYNLDDKLLNLLEKAKNYLPDGSRVFL